jgi:hypothetical protein
MMNGRRLSGYTVGRTPQHVKEEPMSETPPEPPVDGPEGQVPADDPAAPEEDLDANDMDAGTPAEESPPPA